MYLKSKCYRVKKTQQNHCRTEVLFLVCYANTYKQMVKQHIHLCYQTVTQNAPESRSIADVKMWYNIPWGRTMHSGSIKHYEKDPEA